MIKPILNEKERTYLASVIQEVEKNTSGEIRLIIARRSSVIGHVFPILSLQCLIIFMSVLWWHQEWFHWPVVLGGLIVIAVGCFFLARCAWVCRLLTAKDDLSAQVWSRAEREFARAQMSLTADRTGILLFLSLMERQAVVLADKGIAAKLPQETWSEVVRMTLAGARRGEWQASLETAIRKCGDLLKQHFPIRADDRNELENHVILLD